MWWNRRDGEGDEQQTDDDAEKLRTSSVPPPTSKQQQQQQPQTQANHKHSNSQHNRQSFLSTKSLSVAHLTQRKAKRKGGHNNNNNHSTATSDELESNSSSTVAETYTGFEVSIESLSPTKKSTKAATNNHNSASPRSPQQQLSNGGSNHNKQSSPTTTNNNVSMQRGGGPRPSQQQQQQQQQYASRMAAPNSPNRLLPQSALSESKSSVVSFKEELTTRQKIHRAQYSVAEWPVLGPRRRLQHSHNRRTHHSTSNHSRQQGPQLLKPSRHHRVQFPQEAAAQPQEVSSGVLPSYEDTLFLLRSHEVVDEMTSLKEEISHMNAELEAVQRDKTRLEEMRRQLEEEEAASDAAMPDSPPSSPPGNANNSNIPTAWDWNELLASKSSSNTITLSQRNRLQSQRGINLTVYFHDRKTTEALAAKCGIKSHVLAKFRDRGKRSQLQQQKAQTSQQELPYTNNGMLELTADTCREGGAATFVQHISLLCKDGSSESSFFLSRDQGSKSIYWGHLPDRLFRRMRDSGMSNPKQSASELSYLATGPMDYYYAEFRSGECWWGTSVNDVAFHSICTEWDIFAVVFGPPAPTAALPQTSSLSGQSRDDDDDSEVVVQQQHSSTSQASAQQRTPAPSSASWVILSRDGRVAWKNLAPRLDRLLSRRQPNQAGLAELSLGCGDAYYCRFLDGTVDYVLPSRAAEACKELERRGCTITSVALHPELSHDFVIRSTSAVPISGSSAVVAP